MSATLSEQLACVKRELALRRNTYPKWVASGRMTKEEADKEIEHMAAVAESINRLIGFEKDSDEMTGRKTQPVELV